MSSSFIVPTIILNVLASATIGSFIIMGNRTNDKNDEKNKKKTNFLESNLQSTQVPNNPNNPTQKPKKIQSSSRKTSSTAWNSFQVDMDEPTKVDLLLKELQNPSSIVKRKSHTQIPLNASETNDKQSIEYHTKIKEFKTYATKMNKKLNNKTSIFKDVIKIYDKQDPCDNNNIIQMFHDVLKFYNDKKEYSKTNNVQKSLNKLVFYTYTILLLKFIFLCPNKINNNISIFQKMFNTIDKQDTAAFKLALHATEESNFLDVKPEAIYLKIHDALMYHLLNFKLNIVIKLTQLQNNNVTDEQIINQIFKNIEFKNKNTELALNKTIYNLLETINPNQTLDIETQYMYIDSLEYFNNNTSNSIELNQKMYMLNFFLKHIKHVAKGMSGMSGGLQGHDDDVFFGFAKTILSFKSKQTSEWKSFNELILQFYNLTRTNSNSNIVHQITTDQNYYFIIYFLLYELPAKLKNNPNNKIILDTPYKIRIMYSLVKLIPTLILIDYNYTNNINQLYEVFKNIHSTINAPSIELINKIKDILYEANNNQNANDKLTPEKYKSKIFEIINRVNNVDQCPLCLNKIEPFQSDPEKHVIILPCTHIFHQECIHTSIAKYAKNFCPVCRSKTEIDDILNLFDLLPSHIREQSGGSKKSNYHRCKVKNPPRYKCC